MGIRQIFTDGRHCRTTTRSPGSRYSVGRGRATRWSSKRSDSKTGAGWISTAVRDRQGPPQRALPRTKYGTLEIEQTIDDPKAYTRPFTVRLNQQLMPDTEIMEMVCMENNQSIHHLVGADGKVAPPTPPPVN